MKYIIKTLAILPALSVGFTSIILFILALDYHWLSLLGIANSIGTFILLDKYEDTVNELTYLFKILSK